MIAHRRPAVGILGQGTALKVLSAGSDLVACRRPNLPVWDTRSPTLLLPVLLPYVRLVLLGCLPH